MDQVKKHHKAFFEITWFAVFEKKLKLSQIGYVEIHRLVFRTTFELVNMLSGILIHRLGKKAHKRFLSVKSPLHHFAKLFLNQSLSITTILSLPNISLMTRTRLAGKCLLNKARNLLLVYNQFQIKFSVFGQMLTSILNNLTINGKAVSSAKVLNAVLKRAH